MQGTLCALLMTTACLAAGQSSSFSDWVGVWQGELDGQPCIILTLAADDGALQGTLVLNGISRDGGTPHIAAREAHVLVHPKVVGTTLFFEVRRVRGAEKTMEFSAEKDSLRHAKIHCLNCSDDAPVVEIARED